MKPNGNTTAICRRAPAKVNLALSIGPPSDGMHPIASWMHCIDLADDVEVAAGERSLRVEWARDAAVPGKVIDWSLEDDLTAKAHRLLEREVGRPLEAAITVRKRIPVGGGLGGGSSDAAAVLLGLNEACGLGVPLERLVVLSREIGSDVAFFVDQAEVPRPAVVTGIGERVERLSADSSRDAGWQVVLIVPPYGCPTGAVYRAYDELGPRQLRTEAVRDLAVAGVSPEAALFNDLTEAAERVEPRLREVRLQCEAALGQRVHMSGSGSTLFVIASGERALPLAQAARSAAPGASVVLAHLVP